MRRTCVLETNGRPLICRNYLTDVDIQTVSGPKFWIQKLRIKKSIKQKIIDRHSQVCFSYQIFKEASGTMDKSTW